MVWNKYIEKIERVRDDILCEEESDNQGEIRTQYLLLALDSLAQATRFLRLVNALRDRK